MNAPNAELMEFYGTDIHYLEKSGALSPGMLTALRVAAPIGSMAMVQSDAAHRQKILMEAEAMNQALRWVENQRMAGVAAGFSGRSAQSGFGKFGSLQQKDPVLSPELHKFAEDIGRRLARGTAGPELVALMEKAASGGELTEMEKAALIGKMLGGFGKALGSVGKAVGGTGGLKVGRGGLAQKAGDFLRKKGIGARTSGLVRRGIKAAPAGAAKSKNLLSFGTKAKMLGVGALALGGYGVAKGAKAGRDYMMRPTAMGRQGSYGPAPSHNVGGYGYNIGQM